MGIPWLQIIDFDLVEPSNLASQGYLEDDLGKFKVDATADLCRKINSGLEIHAVSERFRRSMEVGNIIFCCVDTIDARRLIWQAVKNKVNCFLDARMSAEVLRVLTACDFESRKRYGRPKLDLKHRQDPKDVRRAKKQKKAALKKRKPAPVVDSKMTPLYFTSMPFITTITLIFQRISSLSIETTV